MCMSEVKICKILLRNCKLHFGAGRLRLLSCRPHRATTRCWLESGSWRWLDSQCHETIENSQCPWHTVFSFSGSLIKPWSIFLLQFGHPYHRMSPGQRRGYESRDLGQREVLRQPLWIRARKIIRKINHNVRHSGIKYFDKNSKKDSFDQSIPWDFQISKNSLFPETTSSGPGQYIIYIEPDSPGSIYDKNICFEFQ